MPPHLRRRTDTLIPVKLRLLDESGRHRIAEPMLGIAVEVSGYDLLVSVMGRAGRPLSFGLPAKQKVVVSFLATELHEKVESLVCELMSVEAVSGQPDAWRARLVLPALMPDLAEEIITALHRYGHQRRKPFGGWTTFGLATAAALAAWFFTSWTAEQSVQVHRWQAETLRGQLASAEQNVTELERSLEEADRVVEQQRRGLAEAEEARANFASLKAEHDALLQRANRDEPPPRSGPNKVHLRGVSLTDFRTVRSIRGAATAPRLAYRDGTLELITATPEQRRLARNAGQLLTVYAQLRGAPLSRRGSWSLESPDGAIGLETEEAFVLDDATKDKPDFVFETRDPAASTWLSAYAAMGISEVWTWRSGRVEFRRLVNGEYAIVPRSSLLPELDPRLLARFIARDDQTVAVQEFTRTLEQSSP